MKISILRNYVVIGNEDAQELLANNIVGQVTPTKVVYVWFKVKNTHFLCTENEYNQNIETVRKYMSADLSEYGNLNVKAIDSLEKIRIKYSRILLSDLSPNQISKVVSSTMFLLISNLISS